MNDIKPENYYYPNQFGRIILLSMEEVIGNHETVTLLNQADLSQWIEKYPPNNLELKFSFEHVSSLQQALEEIYGTRSGRGLATRVGRACFKHGLREYGTVVGFTGLAYRLLPLDEKLRNGATMFANVFNRFSDQIVSLNEDSEHLYWKIERCPVCWHRSTDAPACHLAVGLLQEALYWVSSGKHYHVEETACVAQGDPACLFMIRKKAVD